MSVDSSREVRAMAMLALPCPPMPIMASREAPDECNSTVGEGVGNSHDLVAHLMNVRAAAGQEGVNERRMRAQVAAHESLIGKFDAWAASHGGGGARALPPIGILYGFFADFTREYVAAFLDGAEGGAAVAPPTPDVRMPPPESVRVGDPVHRAALAFALAQDQIFGESRAWRRAIGPHTPYTDLLVLSALRILESGE